MKTVLEKYPLHKIEDSWIKEFSLNRNEPPWVQALRKKAFEQYNALPWPTAKEDKWKQTPLQNLKWDTLQFSTSHTRVLETAKELSQTLATLSDSSGSNGKTPGEVYWDYNVGYRLDLPSSLRKQGIRWMPLEEAIQQEPAMIQIAWEEAIKRAKTNKFCSLSLAIGNGGLCLFIPPKTKVLAPLQQYLAGGGASIAHFPLHFLFIEEESETQIWEELVSRHIPDKENPHSGDANHPGFVCSYTVVHLKANSKASFYKLQNLDNFTIHFQFQDIKQESHSQLETVAIAVGGKHFRNESSIFLNGPGAENTVLGVLFGNYSQTYENWITQNHRAPHTTSDIQYRGALQGKAHSFFSGMVSIIKEAQQSDAFQSSKSLILSKGARAEAIPNLEILADDVKCAHGAAVGPVDEDQKYYLETRGIPPALAEKIIIQGFVEPVIAAVPSEVVQERLRSFIEEKIQKT